MAMQTMMKNIAGINVMRTMVTVAGGGRRKQAVVVTTRGGSGGVRQTVMAGGSGGSGSGGGGVRQTVMAGSVDVTFTTRSISSIISPPYIVPEGSFGENMSARLELAAAYRGLDQLGLNEGVCNHLTVMAPTAHDKQGGNIMLVVNFGLHWSEVKASELLGVDKDAKLVEGEGEPDLTASCIHLGIRSIRPDAKVIMHTHQPYATALACLKDPRLLMVHQNSTRFYQRVAYDNCYSGLALAMDEGCRLGQVLGNKDVLFMGNHGVIVVAPTVALAFDNLYYLERAAQVQILAQSTQKELALIPEKECQQTSQDIWNNIKLYSDAAFYAMYRKLKRTQPNFEF
ncbi:hypothetical protein Pmani_005182 [Petrolisthes manimaculis]|uniref:Class II aldolase/adducin N-terminal domain-containing protein n=1 Tax=Petrolisthes manimaculis TaxID=1843537 RepID=A0AAE1QCQ7_9EUCA|nr:hypothetical protein Pmani_005182 [Petrolisthes manimaculis]